MSCAPHLKPLLPTNLSNILFSSSKAAIRVYSTAFNPNMESSLRAFENVPRSAIYDSIYDTIGRTPIIKLNKMSPKKGVDVFVKLESENPGGSVKDRLAIGVIEWAEKKGTIKKGQTGE